VVAPFAHLHRKVLRRPIEFALTFTDDAFKRSIQDETGIKPAWGAESFPDPDEDVRQSIARIKASPFRAAHRRHPWLRLRRRHRHAQRGQLTR